MYRLLILCLLFHWSFMISLALANVTYFLSQPQWWGSFLSQGIFQEMNLLGLSYHLLFFVCWIFNFPIIVTEELLKALATFVGSFSFSSFTSNLRTCLTECTFPLSFFIKFHVFLLLLGFAVSLMLCSFLAYFITFLRILPYLV